MGSYAGPVFKAEARQEGGWQAQLARINGRKSISSSPALVWGTHGHPPSALRSQSLTRTLPEQGSGFLDKRWEQRAHQRVGSQLMWQDKSSKAPASPGFNVFPRSILCICTTPWIRIHSRIPKLKWFTYFLLGNAVRSQEGWCHLRLHRGVPYTGVITVKTWQLWSCWNQKVKTTCFSALFVGRQIDF